MGKIRIAQEHNTMARSQTAQTEVKGHAKHFPNQNLTLHNNCKTQLKASVNHAGLKREQDSPGYNQNWVCGDVMRNGNMATEATHTTLISSELFLGPKSSLFVTRLCTEYD